MAPPHAPNMFILIGLKLDVDYIKVDVEIFQTNDLVGMFAVVPLSLRVAEAGCFNHLSTMLSYIILH